MAILTSSLICLTIPSVAAGLLEQMGVPVFKTLGPFYIVGLLASADCNSIVYIRLHKEIRHATAAFLSSVKVSLLGIFSEENYQEADRSDFAGADDRLHAKHHFSVSSHSS